MFRRHLHRIQLQPPQQQVAERLYRHVDVLSSLIGPRHWWRYDMLLAAQRYVESQLAMTNLAVEHQTYEVMGRQVANLIVEQRGETKPDQIIVLGAHYDTVDTTPGADDNASAVAGLLEIAQQLSQRKFKRTIRYVAFVNEEPPFYKSENMGSLRYARRCSNRDDNIIGMINLEMIGYYSDEPNSQQYPELKWIRWALPTRANFIVICSDLESTRFLSRVAWGFRRSVKFPMLPFPAPRSVSGPGMSDNWSFWEVGYPAVMVTDTSFFRNDHYHKSSDRIETLDFGAMTKVVTGVSGALARIAGTL